MLILHGYSPWYTTCMEALWFLLRIRKEQNSVYYLFDMGVCGAETEVSQKNTLQAVAISQSFSVALIYHFNILLCTQAAVQHLLTMSMSLYTLCLSKNSEALYQTFNNKLNSLQFIMQHIRRNTLLLLTARTRWSLHLCLLSKDKLES